MKFYDCNQAEKCLAEETAATVELELDENKFFIERNVDEYPKMNSFYSEDIHEVYFSRGWNSGGHCFSNWKLTPWEFTRWGTKEEYDAAHYIPEKADLTQPVEVGEDVFQSMTGWHATNDETRSPFAYAICSLTYWNHDLCYGRIVITSKGKLKAIKVTPCRNGGYEYSVKEVISLDEVKATFAQEQAAAKKAAEEEKKKKKEFARMCTRKARMYKIPFEIALSFRGSDEEIENFINSLKWVINEKLDVDFHELYCGRRRNAEEMARLGIDTGWVDTNRINYYVAACLKSGKILQKY